MVDNTYRSKLIEYVKRNLKKGYPTETLRIALIKQGYMRSMIDEAIKEATSQMASEVPIIKEKPQIEHEIISGDEIKSAVKKSILEKIIDFFRK